jgi:hypothetical protein
MMKEKKVKMKERKGQGEKRKCMRRREKVL